MPRRILFVCTGNTCRSPMAQAIAVGISHARGQASAFTFDSAGIAPGGRATDDAVDAITELQLDPAIILNRESRKVSDVLESQRWDMIVVMEDWMKTSVRSLKLHGASILTLHELAGEAGQVPDPLGCPPGIYKLVAKEIKRLLEAGWGRLTG